MTSAPDKRLTDLAGSAAEWLSVKERGFMERAADRRGSLIASFEAHARFLEDALAISAEDARNHCDGQLADLEDEPAMSPDVFEGGTFRKIFLLACGESPPPVDKMERALRRVEKALASRQMVVNVAQQPINVTVPAPQVSVNVAAPEPAPRQDKPWPTRTVIKKRDAQGRADIIETTPIDA